MLASAALDWVSNSSGVCVVPPRPSIVCADVSTSFSSGSYWAYSSLILAVSPALAASCICFCKAASLFLSKSCASIARPRLGGSGITRPAMTAPGRSVSLIPCGTTTGGGGASPVGAGNANIGSGAGNNAWGGAASAGAGASGGAGGGDTCVACAAASCSAACLAAISFRAAPLSDNRPTAPKGPSKPT